MPRLGSGIPLVARTHEMRRLRAAFARAERGEAGAVLVAGDAGVGKTRLLAALGEHAAGRGALVLTGRCIDVRDGGLPYLPFAEALEPLGAAADPVVAAAVRVRPALRRLLPQGGVPEPAGGDHGQVSAGERDSARRPRPEQDLGQLQLFDAVLGVLTEIARDRPVVLVVEDLHWADPSTRDLLSVLLSRLRTQRLLVVGSYREEDVHRRHPLRGLLSELVRLATVERLELPPFAPADARAFVSALAEEPLHPQVIAEIAERSEGNPFFVEELLASGADCDDLPAGLAEVLLARLERLPDETRRVLRVVAVAGEGVSHAALAQVAGVGELELDDVLREAVQHHVLVIEDGFYVFRHALLQEAVYADLLPGERTRMHAGYAARIREIPQGRGKDAKLAYHSLESGDFGTALPALLRAMYEAEKLGAPGAALRHVERALSIWDAVPEDIRPDDVDEVKLLHEASYFSGTSGEPERAVAYARSAVDALTSETSPPHAAHTWRRYAEALLVLDGTFDEAMAAIERAWQLLEKEQPSAARAWVLAARAGFLRSGDRPDEALASALTAVADARSVGSAGAEASALVTLGTLADSSGDAAEARERLGEALRKAHDAGSLNVELRARYFLALSHDDQAELEPALAHAAQGAARAEETGLTWSSYGLELRARQLHLRYLSGDWPEQDEAGRGGRGVSSAVVARILAIWVLFLVARGRFDEAGQLVAELRRLWTADIQIALNAGDAAIQLAAWRGDHAKAVEGAEELVAWLEKVEPSLLGGIRVAALGMSSAVALAAEARARGDQRAEEAFVRSGRRLLEHGRRCATDGTPRSGTLGPEGRAWLARLEAAASGLHGQPDPARWSEAAEAFAYGAVYEQAVCRWHEASARLAAGQSGTAALEAAHEVAVKLGATPLRDAVRTLARRARVDLPGAEPAASPPGPSPLTERERDVLERVALGRTNRQVGEELYISEKTVSVHLSRVMAKLGASRRAEAVAIAYDRGLLTTPAE
ncbi:DNA-binding CsgD family transcriptional regulator/tetratricopeptide (TPR) repeat protein [Amycolatopsis jiangsuensis]|uniref:DNA-binding CsgD family transcriptional regulator/tetratricopeptide (TPR) repeat protein n=1 Tax=Amycolatopsis jiangsuensis TaxID=1181879 RepID=A0A840IU74_9PSEU|nr:DNA-binding CsgD family transcriptional regulator/tetratricopeptide (TPR) repeat protein [Amycolatopsis jiangsuensis]